VSLMKTIRNTRSIVLSLAVSLLPTLVQAEVSAVVDHQGHFKRLVVLTRDRGRSPIIWGQVRPSVPLALILNPLGDNHGDLRPVIKFNPATGAPWAFWSMNIANQKRIGYAYWNGAAWSVSATVVPDAGSYYEDQLDPDVAFGLGGTPFLVWWQPGLQGGTVYFSTPSGASWSPPLALTDGQVDSRKPTIVLAGSTAVVTYTTPSGPVTQSYDTAILFQSAMDLMDGPLPPGQSKTDPGGSRPAGKPGDQAEALARISHRSSAATADLAGYCGRVAFRTPRGRP